MPRPVTTAFDTATFPASTKEGQKLAGLFRKLQKETGMLVPPRKALSFAAAAPFAPYLGILEIKEPMQATVRIIGTAIVNRTQIDNTGKNWLDLFTPALREVWWEHLRRILQTPCLSVGLFRESYQRIVVIEGVSFPFADASGTPRYVVSTTTELDRNQLFLRGEYGAQNATLVETNYFDIRPAAGWQGLDAPRLGVPNR